MPDTAARAVHTLTGHSLVGANWRPMHFTKDLPPSRVCGLCRTVPIRTVLLPCSHFLCDSCNGARDQDGHYVCPLDLEPFDEGECLWNDFPATRVNSLQAHCWNECGGCKFVGPVEAVLLHYDKECDVHSVQCPRCEQRIRRAELTAHYVTGCSRPGRSSGSGQKLEPGDSFDVRSVSATLDEMKSFLTDPCHQQLAFVQGQMTELLELFRTSDTVRLREISHVVRSSEENLAHKMEEFKSDICTTVTELNAGMKDLKAPLRDPYSDHLPNLQSQINEVIEESKAHYAALVQEITTALKGSESKLEVKIDTLQANLSSVFTLQLQPLQSVLHCLQQKKVLSESESGLSAATPVKRRIPWPSEKKLILRKLEAFAIASLSTLELLRQKNLSHGGHPWISNVCKMKPWIGRTLSEIVVPEECVITVRNADQLFQAGNFITDLILWHGNDVCLNIALLKTADSKVLAVHCRLLADMSCFSWDYMTLTALNEDPRNNITLRRVCRNSKHEFGSSEHIATFRFERTRLASGGFIKAGELKFSLKFYEARSS